MSRVIRIGFLVDSLLSRYQIRLLNAVRKPARRKGAVVLGFPGSYLVGADPDRPIFDGSFIFDLAGPANVDGIIVASNVLLSGIGATRLLDICKHCEVPAVSIGPLSGFPSVDIDNHRGLERVIEHLVDVHDRRQLAFIRGPLTNPDSLDRERVFRSTLQRLGIETKNELFVTGNFLEASGANAVRTLLDERRLLGRIDAIVIANDQMAAGAIRELRQRGIRVPEEVSIVGFDDDEHARSTNPPLTTVAQPVSLLGETAVELLLGLIEGRSVESNIRLETVPVWRRSCGCVHGVGFIDEPPPYSLNQTTALTDYRERFAERFAQTVGFRHTREGIDIAVSILASTDPDELSVLARNFEHFIWDAAEQGVDPLQWEDIFDPLRSIIERQASTTSPPHIDVGLRGQTIHWLLAELSARVILENQLRTLELSNALRVVGSAVVCARHLRALARVLDAGLSGLDIRFCCVCVFTDSNRQRARVGALYDPVEPKPHDQLHTAEQLWRAIPPTLPPGHYPSNLNLNQSTFPANTILPESALSTARIDLLVYPLVFAEEALGFLVIDAPDDPQRFWLREGLSGHLSSAVYEIARTEQLRMAREQAEEASSAKSDFVAMMSHEVRTPLNAVIGNLDLCLRTELTREQRRYLQRAHTSSRTLIGIVDNILDFSRIDAKRMDLEHTPFELEAVLEQLIVNCSAEASRKNLEFIIDVAPNVPETLVGDSLRLMQVLVNLVSNAIKFSNQGHVALRIDVIEQEPTVTHALRYQVEDTGIGMSATQIERIFLPFTQADSSITRRYGGTGLGLTISQRLVELMGGSLSVRSQPGNGSVFQFSLPLSDTLTNDAQYSRLPIQVVVVESYAPQAEALARLLDSCSSNVEVTPCGDTALTFVTDVLTQPGNRRLLVLVDSQLDDISGVFLCKKLRELDAGHRLELALLVPYNNEAILSQDWQQAGADVVLAKPVQRSSLLRVLEHTPDNHLSFVNAQSETQQPLCGWRILVVQDCEISRELARDLLVLSGAEVLLATDGAEAVRIAETELLDLILMDLNLPTLDGCGATRAIRRHERAKQVPIIALSASCDKADRDRCLDAGMNDFVRTPVSAALLVATVQKWCAINGVHSVAPTAAVSGNLGHRPVSGAPVALEIARTLGRLGGNMTLYRKLLKRFVQMFTQQRQYIQNAFVTGDYETATGIVHSLVSSAGNIGATRLQQIAQSLETALRNNNTTLVQVQKTHLETEMQNVFEAAKRALNQTDGSSHPPPNRHVADVESKLDSLRRLINEHDTAAVEVVDSLEDAFAESSQNYDSLKRLAQSVMAYDFEAAAEQLDTLTVRLKNLVS
jgi:signal transduction histidine kinase/DNA-binding LacI/PurR family transcriptional regulator/DNA-binding response OmpR family regulator/HPt (histidine-containing phosphotransfer) domain-containing protein